MRQGLVFLSLLIGIAGCARHEIGDPPDYTTLTFPLAIMPAADESRVYVVDTDFDMDYSSGWIAGLDVQKMQILPEQAIRVKPYGGALLMGPGGRHAYLMQRWDSSIITFDVDNKGLHCGQKGEDRTCGDDHILYDKSEYDPVQKDTLPRLGTDGFSGCIMDVKGIGPVLFAASVSDSFLAGYDISKGKPAYLGHILLDPGVGTLACDSVNQRIYAGHSTANLVDVVDVTVSDKKLELNRPFGFSAPMTSSRRDYFRQLQLSPQGDLLYATYRSPDSMLVFDAMPSRMLFVTSLGLPAGAGRFGFIDDPVYGRYAVVACSDDGSIAIVSMDTFEVMKRIRLCRDPYGLRVLPASKKVVVACFRGSSIGVLKWKANPVTSMQVEGFLK